MPRRLRAQIGISRRSFHASEWGDLDDDRSELGPISSRLKDLFERVALEATPPVDPSDLIRRTDFMKLAEAAAKPMEPALIRTMPDLHDQLYRGRQRIAEYLDDVWGPPDRLYESITYMAYEIGRRASLHRHQDHQMKALLGLHARACRVSGEVRILAMNGFAAGATARWRSLHELAVVSSVIGSAGSEIAERYLAASVIEQYRDACSYQQHAPRLGYALHGEADLAAWACTSEAALDRFGAALGTPNGWAKPLFPTKGDRERVTFRELEELADLDHWRPFYELGSHHVHAGPRSAELNVVPHLPSGPVLTTGATVYADIAETCHGSLISLLFATNALVARATALDSPWSFEHLIGITVMRRFIDRAGERYSAAADDGRSRGLFDHGPQSEEDSARAPGWK